MRGATPAGVTLPWAITTCTVIARPRRRAFRARPAPSRMRHAPGTSSSNPRPLDVPMQRRHRALLAGQDGAQFDGRRSLAGDQHAAALDERCDRDAPPPGRSVRRRIARQSSSRPSSPSSVACDDDVQDALLQVALESVHDRQHGDQRHDPEGDAGHRDTGYETDESIVATRAQIAQADPAGPYARTGRFFSWKWRLFQVFHCWRRYS